MRKVPSTGSVRWLPRAPDDHKSRARFAYADDHCLQPVLHAISPDAIIAERKEAPKSWTIPMIEEPASAAITIMLC